MIFLDPEHNDDTLVWMSTASYVLLGTFSFVAIVGNGFVFWAMIVDKRLRTNSNFFILSLALSDFLMGCISIPVYMTLHIVEQNILGNVFCSIIAFIDNTLVIVSMWTLVLTSLDRFLLIIYQRLYHVILNRKNTILMILSCWLYAVVIAGLPLLGWNKYAFTGNTCSIKEPDHPYFRVFFFLTFPVPLIITATCYIWIAIRANKAHSKAQSNSKHSLTTFGGSAVVIRRQRSTATNDRVTRLTIMVFGLVVAHIVLTLPAFTLNLVTTFKMKGNHHYEGIAVANDIVILMFFANAAVNPILYGLFNTNFQAAFDFCPCQKLQKKTSPKVSVTRSPNLTHLSRSTFKSAPQLSTKATQLAAESKIHLKSSDMLEDNSMTENNEVYVNNLNVPSVI